MLFTVENEQLKVTVDTHGAELQSIYSKIGCEYLWQGDPDFWKERSPVLFPFIGRLEGKKYLHQGKEYDMGIHGFAKTLEFLPDYHGADTLVMTLTATEETRKVYPFDFLYEITFRLEGNVLVVGNRVVNQGTDEMHFALGGHPGFRVPLAEEKAFTDYRLTFCQPCTPERILFTEDSVLVSGKTEPYALENGNTISLHHDLFDNDAIILQNAARQVTLTDGIHGVTVSYPNMPYIGFWHCTKKPAPYVCIEPWSSLPGRAGITEDIALREDFIHLPAGQVYENNWTVSIF